MDVVSDAIAAVRIGRPSTNRLRVAGRWSARIPGYDGAGFHVVLEGGCWLLPDGGTPVSLAAGDAVLLPHGTGHVLAGAPLEPAEAERAVPVDQLLGPGGAVPGPRPPQPAGAAGSQRRVADGPVTELLCGKYRLEHSRTHPLMRELPDVLHLPTRVGSHPELRAAVDLLGRELAAERAGGALAVPGLVDLLLVYLVRAWLECGLPDAGPGPGTAGDPRGGDGAGACAGSGARTVRGRWPAALSDPVVSEALRAVHEDPARDWSADGLAARAGVSRATLTRRFTALVGRPPMAYLAWWRMTRAATLLQETDDPLEAIARRVGYSTPYALSHAFSRLFGTTPGRYRAARCAATTAVDRSAPA
ncbi:AraC family transcriptional regulator [Kitasatospora sp. A2-31]|uniref:AraC family transcriptional regulator n=1 Tax=Kitasatospora sp. A2-31 TaxID=2916414 RepID=UPI001EEC9F44|nr:AraC family transcriptional regulator [Kitasatospora sp. A2-31]MCG6493876.1 AraC family transcriptional regulator [Kitasatospora sp. A2-31]